MQALSSEAIIIVYSQVHPDLHPHASTVAYIQTLLSPYATAVEGAVTVESITQWIPQVLPTILSEHAAAEMEREIRKSGAANRNIPEILVLAKQAFIEYLVAELAELSGNVAQEEGDGYIILPWDVLKAIRDDPEFSVVFKITPQDTTLPVTVTLKGVNTNRNMSVELAMGILLFANTIRLVNYELSMFGIRLSYYELLDPDDLRSLRYITDNFNRLKRPFTVDIGNVIYGFMTPEFMQGIVTGANWVGVDHHPYWKDLRSYSTGPRGELVSKSITF